jgi:hypothetical protein
MRIRTTSTQRTYRYVRLTILAATLLLAVAVGVQATMAGGPLPSLSAAYYTPAGPMFVAALFVVAAAFVALSGHSVEQGLLDVAAVLALVIAVVPTTVESEACGALVRCVPPPAIPAAVNNGIAVASVVLVGVVAGVVLSVVQGTVSRGVVLTAGTVACLVVGLIVWATVSPTSFLAVGHNVAAVGFFLLVGAVAGIAAWRPQRAPERYRPAYAAVAIGILFALAGLSITLAAAAGGADIVRPVPWLFVGEAVALVLFAVFWFLQTAELWNDPNPRLRA